MKHLSWLFCILLILAGCTDTSIEGISTHSDEEFYATIEGSYSRTYVDDQIRLRWTADDRLTIFKKTTYNREFMFTGVTGANAGGFKQKSVDDDFWYGADVPYNYAVYPHSSTTQLDETDHFFTLTMPAEQTYVENSFGLGANTMVAVSESGQLMFKNVGSYLRVRLYGKDIAVSSITLTSKGDEAISGKAKVTPSLNGNPTCEMTGTGKSIRLNCPEPVTISEDADNPTDFWIVVPPVTLANGFSVTVENDKGDTLVFDRDNPFTFVRNKYTDMKREVVITMEDTTPYVTFTADAEQTLTMSKAIESLEYSVNRKNWNTLGTNTVTFGGDNGDLCLRGKSASGTNGSQITFGNSTNVACSGDIRTIIDYENYTTTNTSSASFSYLFYNTKNLIAAPELPIKDLKWGCYSHMFSGCTNLKSPPELPATNLAPECYYGMFERCTNLETAPKLSATNLGFKAHMNSEYCYANMFANCIKLKEAPDLPATTLASGCYANMFEGCSSLISAPKLPATTLESSCYFRMFMNCTSLTTAPELPAVTLAMACYSAMFRGCTSLTTAPILPATRLEMDCYSSMFLACHNLQSITMLATDNFSASFCFDGWTAMVASTGTFTKAKGVTLPKGDSGIPENWTVVEYE